MMLGVGVGYVHTKLFSCLKCWCSVLNGGHRIYIGQENLSEMGIYRGYFQKSDVKIGL